MKAGREARQRGVALVAVLWFVIAAAGLSLTFVRHGQADLVAGRSQLDAVQVRGLLDAGVARAAAELIRVREVRSPPRQLELTLDTGRVTIRIDSESGKVDLNRATAGLLTALAQQVGVERRKAQGIGDAIVDWRDEGDAKQPRGAESREYGQADSPWRPANQPFRHPDELKQVLNVDPVTFEKLRPHVTVYTGLDRPEQRLASGPARQALALSTETAEPEASQGADGSASGLSSEGASTSSSSGGDSLLERATGDEGSGELGARGGEDAAEPEAPAPGEIVVDPKQVFALSLEARLPGDYVGAERVVIWLTDTRQRRPFRILDRTPLLPSETGS